MDAEGDIHVLLFGLAEFSMEIRRTKVDFVLSKHCQGEEQLAILSAVPNLHNEGDKQDDHCEHSR